MITFLSLFTFDSLLFNCILYYYICRKKKLKAQREIYIFVASIVVNFEEGRKLMKCKNFIFYLLFEKKLFFSLSPHFPFNFIVPVEKILVEFTFFSIIKMENMQKKQICTIFHEKYNFC